MTGRNALQGLILAAGGSQQLAEALGITLYDIRQAATARGIVHPRVQLALLRLQRACREETRPTDARQALAWLEDLAREQGWNLSAPSAPRQDACNGRP